MWDVWCIFFIVWDLFRILNRWNKEINGWYGIILFEIYNIWFEKILSIYVYYSIVIGLN